ncbi:Pycsar system effector family protein [Saccharopolyspora sp. NPDC000359]|uniref:Pycsar system effector family protein n=1 Tax=Saccharopolyspora sp. NPDC000359 TaxID=3154251 RepID=UPI00332CB125
MSEEMMSDEVSEQAAEQRLIGRRDELQALRASADAKAQAMLAPMCAGIGGAVALVKFEISPTATVLLGLAAVAASAALITTLLVLLPRLGRPAVGLVRWARMSATEHAAEARAGLSVDELARHVARLSRIVPRKFRLLQLAGWLLIATTALVAASLLA